MTECFINETIGNFLLFGIAIPLHQGWPVFIWLISFLCIRIHLGGYHAPHHWLCLVISTFVGISSIFFNWIWNSISGYSILILFFCDAYILFTKAVIHENHPMTQKKLRRERFLLLINTFLINTIVLASLLTQKSWYPPILSGIFCSVVMSIIAKFQKQTRQWFNISHLAYQSCLASWYLPFHLTRNRHPSAVFRQRISPDGTTLEKAVYKPCSARS